MLGNRNHSTDAASATSVADQYSCSAVNEGGSELVYRLALAGHARVTEVEAWGGGVTPTPTRISP